MNNTTILLIDDDVELGQLLKEYLAAEGFNLEHHLNGNSGLQALNADHQVVLLDVMMPGMDGFEVLKQLRSRSLVPVLMLTAKGDDLDRVLGLELGADDYLPKPYNPRELLARIKALIRRSHYSSKRDEFKTIEIGNLSINTSMREVSIDEHPIPLTQTEYMILLTLAEHKSQVVDKNTLSKAVLGRNLAAYDRSIDMHISNLRKKMASHSETVLIKPVRGSGYVLTSD